MTFILSESTELLLAAAGDEHIVPDEEDAALLQALADYLDSGSNVSGSGAREFNVTVTEAFLAGYAHATGDEARGIDMVLQEAGLT